jgi:hypothetical protein
VRRALLAGSGAVGAAFLGALCCVGPLIFVTFGIGAGLAGTFEPLRPFFGVVMVLLFAIAFYTVYGKPPPSSTDEGTTSGGEAACAVPRSRTSEKAILWLAVVVAIVLWTFPTWSVWLV